MGASTSIERATRALQAGRRARVVQHASLRPAHEDDAAQMRFAVEDALNTADFADCGRLIVVRHLRLSNVPPRASAAVMARAMELAWRAVAWQAVAASHPSASSAPAVYFSSRPEARLSWLERVAQGQKVDAWFWPAALPEVKASSGLREPALAAVVDALLREALPAWVSALSAWPDAVVVRLARAMPQAVHRRMLAALVGSGASTHHMPDGPAARVAAAKALPPSLTTVAARLARQAPVPPDGAPWVAALWMSSLLSRAPSSGDVEAVVTRAVWMAAGVSPVVAGVEIQASRDAADLASASVEGPPRAQASSSMSSSPPVADAMPSPAVNDGAATEAMPVAWRAESGLEHTPHRRGRTTDRPRHFPRGLPWLVDAAFSHNGGLMIVLNVLRAMRFDAASTGTVDTLMLHLLDAVGAAQDEPQRAWFEGEDDGLSRPGASFIKLWRVRIRRILRRRVGLDLAELIRRPAWVSATATHVDVVYPMSEVDLRLRRRGLDADPGWVPWFGRIVTFHFIDDDLLPSQEAEHG